MRHFGSKMFTPGCIVAAILGGVLSAGAQAYVDQVTIPNHGAAYVGQVPAGAMPVVPAPPRPAPVRQPVRQKAVPAAPQAKSLIIERTPAAVSSRQAVPSAITGNGGERQQGGANLAAYPSVGAGVVVILGSQSLDQTLPNASLSNSAR